MLRASSVSLLVIAGLLTPGVLNQPTWAESARSAPARSSPPLISSQVDQSSDFKIKNVDSALSAKLAEKSGPSDAKGDVKSHPGDSKKESGKESTKDSKDKGAKDARDEKDKTSEGKTEKKEKEEVVNELKDAVLTNVNSTTTEDLIDHPKEYLGKNVKFSANFSSFCTLALSYKPAFRSPKEYISFLVKKPDSKVPLSELKLALKIPKEAEKTKNKLLTSLKEDDKIEVTGKVFSAALDEPWIDVVGIKRLQEAKKTDEDSSDEEE